jgi:hypothetical protein
MNPNYGYQLYQAQRIQTRAEVMASDARRGHAAAAAARKRRRTARKTRAGGIQALNAVWARATGRYRRPKATLPLEPASLLVKN